jgi:K+-transporting ATPase c subunit
MIETGMVGRDSLTGGVEALDGNVSPNAAVVQIECIASVVEASQFRLRPKRVRTCVLSS